MGGWARWDRVTFRDSKAARPTAKVASINGIAIIGITINGITINGLRSVISDQRVAVDDGRAKSSSPEGIGCETTVADCPKVNPPPLI
jgi:Zn-dependent alcohol dehydrogenase